MPEAVRPEELYREDVFIDLNSKPGNAYSAKDIEKLKAYDAFLLEQGMGEIYADILRIARGEKPYRTEKDLRDRETGKKLDGRADMRYTEDGVYEYDIFLDSDIEEDDGKKISTYVHERIHTLLPEESDESLIESLTGTALLYLSASDDEAGELARKGYRSYMERQALLGTDYIVASESPGYPISRFQESNSPSNSDRTDVAIEIAGDIGNKAEGLLSWLWKNTAGKFLKNYAGVDADINPGLSKYIADKARKMRQLDRNE